MGHCELPLTIDFLQNFGQQYFEATYSFLIGIACASGDSSDHLPAIMRGPDSHGWRFYLPLCSMGVSKVCGWPFTAVKGGRVGKKRKKLPFWAWLSFYFFIDGGWILDCIGYQECKSDLLSLFWVVKSIDACGKHTTFVLGHFASFWLCTDRTHFSCCFFIFQISNLFWCLF